MQLFFFGDSLVYGTGDPEGGWVNRIKNVVDRKMIDSDFEYYRQVYNLGVSGDTSTWLLERMVSEIKARKTPNKLGAIVIAVGVNDSAVSVATGKSRVTLSRFEKNLSQLITQARKYAEHVVLLGLTPVDDRRVDPIPWRPEAAYRLASVQQYDEVIQKVCRQKKVTCIPSMSLFLARKGWPTLLRDGVHPNDRGHELIADAVRHQLTLAKIL